MYLVSRTETFAKLFFIISFTGLFAYLILAFYSFHTAFYKVVSITKYREHNTLIQQKVSNHSVKYILVWGVDDGINIEKGREPFIKRNCRYSNCYITSNKSLLNEDYSNFDVVLFNVSLFHSWRKLHLPQHRSPFQKYVFYGMELAEKRPICNIVVDNYFNWTWSYKFNSDIYNPFIEVKDTLGNVVAPKEDVSWIYSQTNDNAVRQNKTKALMLIVKNCNEVPKTKFSLKTMTKMLRRHSMEFDVYGCYNNSWMCPRSGCDDVIRNTYYFYLVTEDSGGEDVVTADVLKAYDNNAVPVLAASVNYSKFLPEGSYIDYSYSTGESFAALLEYTIKTPLIYDNYFVWKKYYSINEVDKQRGLCDLCRMLNDESKFGIYSNYESFRNWWNPGPLEDKCLPKGAQTLDEVLAYEKEKKRF